MICIFCGRICDVNPERTCVECKERIRRNDERVYLLSLIKEAVPYVSNRHLRQKMEIALGTIRPFIET